MTDSESDQQSSASDSPDLKSALLKHEIEVSSQQFELLNKYRQIVWETNKQLNLTRHTTFDKFVSRDIVDSLEVGKFLHEEEGVLDVGTGGGVPGIILAIMRPDLVVNLCESVGKKAQAVENIVAELDLPITIFGARAEHILEDFRFDATIARAVGPLWKMCFWFKDCWLSVGRLLAIKGPNWTEERSEARHRGLLNGIELRKVHSYPLAGTESESVILKLWLKGIPEK